MHIQYKRPLIRVDQQLMGWIMTEREAITRLKAGDPGGLETLVRLYQVKALKVSYLISHDYAVSEDVVQSAFVRVYEQIRQFDSDRPFSPWFLRLVANDTLMVVRRKLHVSLDAHAEVQHEEMIEPGIGPEALLEIAEAKEAIWAAVDRLSPKQRAAVVARYYLDWSESETADRFDCPQGTVRRRLFDARQSLRRLLPAWVGGLIDD